MSDQDDMKKLVNGDLTDAEKLIYDMRNVGIAVRRVTDGMMFGFTVSTLEALLEKAKLNPDGMVSVFVQFKANKDKLDA